MINRKGGKKRSSIRVSVSILAALCGVAFLLRDNPTRTGGDSRLSLRQLAAPGEFIGRGNNCQEFESGNLDDYLASLDVGWGSPPSQWLVDLCPEVVDHFTRFPSFKEIDPNKTKCVPIFPTEHAAQAVCTTKVIKALAASFQANIYLYYGAHLGAIRNGQPIPWDDDVDAFMDARFKDELLHRCNGDGLYIHPDVKLMCRNGGNAIKVWLQPNDIGNLIYVKDHSPYDWYSPYIDLFLYVMSASGDSDEVPEIREVFPNGQYTGDFSFQVTDFFPTSPYYFGGIHVLGHKREISTERYDLNTCIMSSYNHRVEKYIRHLRERDRTISCEKLRGRLPFFTHMSSDSISNDRHEQALFPSAGVTLDGVQIVTSIDQRKDWAALSGSMGQELTDGLPNLNTVEVDNTISTQEGCGGKTALKVVQLNAKRGRRWLEFADLLSDADVVILNEMDVGMARTDQQHTTRQLAHYLGMNYAWGMEFMELTPGDGGERKITDPKLPNFHGLHGNAFLTKCGEIRDTTIFRNSVGDYFSDRPNSVNAKGLEKRLGGRMGLLGRIVVSGKSLTVGSVSHLQQYRDEIKDYIGSSQAVLAGDQTKGFCGEVGLDHVGSRGNTWPAYCGGGSGSTRRDIICSNMMEEGEPGETAEACVKEAGINIQYSDHSLVSTVLTWGNDV